MNREEAEKILTHGEWYIVNSSYTVLLRYEKIIKSSRLDTLIAQKGVYLHDGEVFGHCQFCRISEITFIRPATKEEVLKYFPNEVLPEPKERFKAPIIKAPSLKDELKDIMEALRYKGEMDFTNPIPTRKRPITRNKKQYILR